MIKKELELISGADYEEGKDLTLFSSMRLKSSGNLLTVKTKDALIAVQKKLNEMKIEPIVLGVGANQLLDRKSSRPYIKLDFPFNKAYFGKEREIYQLPASLKLSVLSSHAVKFGLQGWESFTGIPATLGGAVFMNAGTNLGEIGPLIKKVFIITKSGEEKIVEITKESFSYRKNNFLATNDIIYQIEMTHLGVSSEISQKIKDYLALRNKAQPLKEFTCGCVFKNWTKGSIACRAGQFIDILGLKGLTEGPLRISPKHANFIENRGGATKDDVLKLIEKIQGELYLQYGVKFETEVQFY